MRPLEKQARVKALPKTSTVFLKAAFAVLFVACASEKAKVSETPINAEFTRPGVVEIRGPKDIRFVEIKDEFQRTVARVMPFAREVFEARFDWKPDAAYTLIPHPGKSIDLHAPKSKPKVALRVHAPLGRAVREYLLDTENVHRDETPIALFVRPNEDVDLLVEVEKLDDGAPTSLTMSMAPDFDATGRSLSDESLMDTVLKDEPISLNFEFDRKIFQNRLHVKSAPPSAPIVIAVEGANIHFQCRLVFSRENTSTEDLMLVAWNMPCNADGTSTEFHAPNQIVLPNPRLQKIGAVFNIPPAHASYYEPFVFQRLDLENTKPYPLNLLLKSTVSDPTNGAPSPFFSSPTYADASAVKPVMGYCQIPPKTTGSCVLPIFVRPETQAGAYRNRIEILPMGSDRPLRTIESELSVLRSHALFSCWMVIVVLVTFGWLLFLAVVYRKAVSAFSVRTLVLLSLLGSMKFCFTFGGGIVSSVLYGFLGPFSCLLGGLLTEVPTFLVITSVLYLVPRVGAMTVAGIVCGIINGILFGAFGLTDILFTGSQIAFAEFFLFAFGVTKLRPLPHTVPKMIPLMLALSIANAASSLTSLTLHAVFFRLFFADWYIVLQVAVTGFLYPLIGVILGRSLGASLRKVRL